jgi:cytochrome c553
MAVWLSALPGATAFAQSDASKDDLDFFEKRIRPVLADKCYKCHAADAEKIKGGLLLDTRKGLRQGGDSGPALVLGEPGRSLLMKAIRHNDPDTAMPPKEKLPDAVIEDFRLWIKNGAADPREGQSAAPGMDLEEGRKWWSLQPVKAPQIPVVKDAAWARSDIDRLIRAGLEAKGLAPVADADRLTLVRRATLDLTGLPPTPEEIAAFTGATSPDALAGLVDRLLASPRFGERWGRHWLDVARYGESSGRIRNVGYPLAWRYRDYVVDAFNADKPFDRFIREQIAGDLMPAGDDRQRNEQDIATGFLAVGVKELHETKLQRFRMEMVDEQIDATTRGILGISLACARCHDHKFDPIPTEDYYALAGIFYSTEPLHGFPRDDRTEPFATGYRTLAGVKAEFTEADFAELIRLTAQRYDLLIRQNKETRELLTAAGKTKADKAEQQAVFKANPEFSALLNDIRENDKVLRAQRARWLAALDSMSMGARDTEPADCKVRIRGEETRLGPTVPRGFPTVLTGPSSPAVNKSQSGRLELAAWLTAESNPLTARVMVNRVWHHLFGTGIVESVDDFGRSGQPPSNPELLDHLATRFVAQGWSVKKLVREIMLSRVYQLASTHNAANYEIDPGNRLHWRMSRRRLDVHALRDSILFVSGSLNLAHPPNQVLPTYPNDRLNADVARDWYNRVGPARTLYLPILRDLVPRELTVFDLPDPELVTGARNITTVPTQALYMLNSAFMAEQSRKLAERLRASADSSDEKRIEQLFTLVLARPPRDSERSDALQFLKEFPAAQEPDEGRLTAWAALSQVLLGSGEFRYVY